MDPKLNILAQSLVGLSKQEFSEYNEDVPKVDYACHEVVEMNKRAIEKADSLEESVKLGYIPKEQESLSLVKLTEEIDKNNKLVVEIQFNSNKKFFGIEKAKQITKFLFTEIRSLDYQEGLISQEELNDYLNKLDNYLGEIVPNK